MRSTRSVLAGYERRAGYSLGETQQATPRLLTGTLHGTRHVAEVPCGSGHFLREYAAAGLTVTLVDGSPRMLAAAVTSAVRTGIPAHRIRTRACWVQRLPRLDGVDAWSVPNGALNQLTAQSSLLGVVNALRGAMVPGARLLAQVLCRHEDGAVDASPFYDPREPEGTWRTDRRLQPPTAGGAAERRRRINRKTDDTLRIAFAYHSQAGACLHTSAVELRVIEPRELIAALHSAGFRNERFLPGRGDLSEVLAEADGARR